MKSAIKFLLAASLFLGLSLAQEVTITYWQYDFAARVDAMSQLIEQFEAENPGIKVVQETFPYDNYQEQVAASLPAGTGPDVVQFFYGWLPTWERSGYIQALPEQYFDTATLDAEFVPMVQAAKLNGAYYGLPTAVRSLALFYNADKLAEAGYDNPPATWDEFLEIAKALTVKRGPRFEQIGYGIAPTGQDHHLLREILTRQFGTAPYSDDGTEVLYDNEAGLEAFKFYTSWVTEHEIGVPEFVPGNSGYRDGYSTQQNIAMIIDGSFAIGGIRNNAEFNWGVAEIPTLDNGVKANFGSFWMNGLSPNAFEDEATLEASAKFLEFVTRPEAMKLWLDVVGEVPARLSLIDDPELASDPVFGPFITSLGYAVATKFVDESAQRDVIVNAINRVVLEGADPAASWSQAAEEDQALLDQYAQ
ncbi:MAG: extracellular solute-binding protein [Trueperaceae bacterium]|nr:extracellular solute-binding protein [Trueperaceae bacterium]